ncbi:MAG: hypothetical protein Q8910_00725 [Bacteroidota bacterium]|nr:hypothetical protein [Bacteroidota bacterium]
MVVKAIKLTKDSSSTKVVYEKDGTLFMRNGEDGFIKGIKVDAPLRSLINKWGFKEIINPPIFNNGKEISQSLNRFELTDEGKVSFVE